MLAAHGYWKMRSTPTITCLLATVMVASGDAVLRTKPLSESAKNMVEFLPKGCIVTAEKVGDTVRFRVPERWNP